MATMQILISSMERIKSFSDFQAKTSTTPWASQKIQAHYDEEASGSSSTCTCTCTCTTHHLTTHHLTTIKTHLRHLFSRSPHHATPPVVDVPFTKAKERHVAAGAPGPDPDIVPDEYLDTAEPDPDTQQQQQPHQQAVAVHTDPGEHGGGKSCVCC
ncbi:uncharacterized protein HD556DRAFT_1539905 [Suillus plorans]|uniref:Uncharacterized protein n=1 Tax=Suillus plorans TaxID=116603 RepID=A0A9P7AB27_9AGAM|nr:uncharacterized protein HD556DRAFT_1539905 [Suillus plorans]KAG1785738.1 hypothetical protein HD556DRAFT_1539905 [Suillus plorans]